MRILHLLNTVRDSGNGIINVAVDLACLQARAGHAVMVASAGGELEELLSRNGVAHCPFVHRLRPRTIVPAAVNVVRHYRAMISRFEPEIVHAHMISGVLIGRIMRYGKPYRLIATVHNEFRRDAVVAYLADRVVAVSEAVASALQRRGIPLEKVSVVKNGPLGSPRRSPILELEAVPLQHPAITTVAGMFRRKGIADLIRAFQRIAASHPTAHLYIVGDGPERAAFEHLAAGVSGADRIHFEGFQREPQRYMLGSDIFVLASAREPFGLVVAEAREAGCAIVATAVDGIPEALDDGRAGILVPVHDIPELAAAIDALLGDVELLQHWRARSVKNLDWLRADRVAEETMEVYRHAGATKSRVRRFRRPVRG
jgi:glycosyltransferase involved in cell wall biosynthesis